MSQATKMSGLIRHLHLVATEPSSAIVFSYSEYAFLIAALSEFKLNHIARDSDFNLTPEGVSVCDSLYAHLVDYFSDLDNLSVNG